jgi:hypothetical protein
MKDGLKRPRKPRPKKKKKPIVFGLVNNANKDGTRDTDFYVENPCGKNHGRQPAIFTILKRVYRTQGIQ